VHPPLALLLADAQATGEFAPEIAATVGPLVGDPVARGDAVAALRRYSLVTLAGDGLVLVHRLVQAITLAQMPGDVGGQWEQAAAALVEAAIPADTALPAAWRVCAVLLPHARAVLDLTSDGMRRIATYLGSSGSYPAARDLCQQIADAYRKGKTYGAEHPDTLAACGSLAYWTGEAGDLAGARDQLAVLLPLFEQVLGPEHPDTLAARGSLARFTGEAGDSAGARDQFAALLAIHDTLAVRDNLASWTGRAGDPAGARDQLAALLPIYEQVSGPEHPDTLTARGSLAYWTGEAGDPAGARDQLAVLLPLFEQVLGPEHPNTLAARGSLARPGTLPQHRCRQAATEDPADPASRTRSSAQPGAAASRAPVAGR
jgi:Tetratricopeptide repeat